MSNPGEAEGYGWKKAETLENQWFFYLAHRCGTKRYGCVRQEYAKKFLLFWLCFGPTHEKRNFTCLEDRGDPSAVVVAVGQAGLLHQSFPVRSLDSAGECQGPQMLVHVLRVNNWMERWGGRDERSTRPGDFSP